ncbi:hypothetical protein [Arthrobacter celericrescens]|uniref:hypothetical protein n=1 Tax=Arthrobacter celericrescens TaxID=2320851 RepID=UPI001FE1BFA3|nr:hypothetical protein [Arthrobacter celericrescens]
MTQKQTVLVVVVTTGLVTLVLLLLDWSPAAFNDPAKTLGLLSPQGVVHLGGNIDRVPFTLFELMMFLAVGLAFVGSGIAVERHRPGRNQGFLLVLAGWLWIAGGLRRSSDPLAFTLGVTLTLMYQPPLLQLALNFPSGVLGTRAEKRAVAFFFAFWFVSAIACWAFFDPRLHATAGGSTSRNLLLLRDSPELASGICDAVRAVQIAVGLAIVLVLVNRWRTGTSAYRASFLFLWLAIIIKTAATIGAALAVTQLAGRQASEVLLWQYPATAVIPLAVLLGLLRYRMPRGSWATSWWRWGTRRWDGASGTPCGNHCGTLP